MRPDGLPIEGYRDHPLIEDCDVYRSGGESAALVYLCDSGDTHFLAPDDLVLLQRLAGTSQPAADPEGAPEGDEDRLDDLRRMGLLRKDAFPELGRDVDDDEEAE